MSVYVGQDGKLHDGFVEKFSGSYLEGGCGQAVLRGPVRDNELRVWDPDRMCPLCFAEAT